MAAVTAPRGPDGSGSWAHGPVALGHRRLKIIDTSERGAQPMVDRGPRPGDRLQRLHLQPPRAARRAGGRGLRLRLGERHRGDPQGLPLLGRGLPRPAAGHVRLRAARDRTGRHAAGARPAGHQAAVPGRGPRGGCALPPAPGAAGRRRRGHLGRPRGAAPLHELARGGAPAADDPGRGDQAAAGHDGGDRGRRPAHRPALVAGRVQPRPRPARWPSPSGTGAAGVPADRGAPPDGGRRARGRAAVRRAGLQPDRGAAGPRRPGGPGHLLDRLPRRRRPRGQRVRLLRPGGPRAGHRPPPDGDRRGPRAARAPPGGVGDGRADGLATTTWPSTCCPRRSPGT